MQYLDFERIDALDTASFRHAHPYPWCNPAALLTAEGYQRLFEKLPDIGQMTPSFGETRAHGQRPHDRYKLEYTSDLDIDPAWHDFIGELKSSRYVNFLKRMFGRGQLSFKYHWHYAPCGASVSPHCDAKNKLGSHIFYFSPPGHWQPEWGGDTVILDDNGRFSDQSAPEFEDFDREYVGESIGNYSLLFQRKNKSWHGVRPIDCPEDHYRKVFIVVINDRLRLGARRVRRKISKKLSGFIK